MLQYRAIIDFDSWLSELPDLLLRYHAPRIRLFIASCCERQQRNYAAFSKEVNWGDPTVLREAGNILWRLDEMPANSYLNAILRELEKVTPDTDDFSSALTSAALDAASSLGEAIGYLIDGDNSHCVTICTLIRDTIYMYLEQGDSLTTSERALQELAKQQADLKLWRNFPN